MATRSSAEAFPQGLGVRHTTKRHPAYGATTPHAHFRCDFCEKRISAHLAHETATGLVFCPDCLHYIETLPAGGEKMLERFLMGNVV